MFVSATFPRILLLANSADRKVIKDAVHRKEPNALFCVAQDETEFLQKLYWIDYSIIIADYHFPNFLGLKAFLWAAVKAPHAPFVFITNNALPDQAGSEDILLSAAARISRNKLPEIGALLKDLLLDYADQLMHEERQRYHHYSRCIQQQKLEAMLSRADAPSHPTKFERIYRTIKIGAITQGSSFSILNVGNIE